MAFDQGGEGGLRRRLRLAEESLGSRDAVANALGISESILSNYLDNPDYVLTSDTYNAIMGNLASVPVYQHERARTRKWLITFTEKPMWTAGDIASLTPPLGATQAVIFVYNAAYPDQVASAGPVDLDLFSIQQIIDSATEGELDNLMTVVWYAPIAEFPYPGS